MLSTPIVQARSALQGLTFLCALFLLSACAQPPAERSFSALLERASQDRFDPPTSGELQPEQVQMYLAIKRQQHQWMQSATANAQATRAKTNSAVRQMLAGLALDVKAALTLGYNTAEYEWVAAKLRTAQTLGPAMIRADREDVSLMMDVLDTLTFKLQSVEDPKLRADYQEAAQVIRQQIEGAGKRRGAVFENYPGISHNFMLYRQHSKEIDQFQP